METIIFQRNISQNNTFVCSLQGENSMMGRGCMHGKSADTSLAKIC